MSDIQVGDRIRITHDWFKQSFPDEYEVHAVPDTDKGALYYIIYTGGIARGFKREEIEKVEPAVTIEPEPKSEFRFAVGDKVKVTYLDWDDETVTRRGVVLAVDDNDETLPYRVDYDDDGYGDWFTSNEVLPDDGEPTSERKDHTALVEDADRVIAAYDVLGIDGATRDIVTRLRDALVEESYREGK